MESNSFDLNDPQKTRVIHAPDFSMTVPDEEQDYTANPLDSEEHQQLHGMLMGFYNHELDRQADNRAEMATDQDFMDGYQWSEEDIATLNDRGQAPITVNVIAQTVNWIIGSEKRGRMDFKVLPRRKDARKPAEKKTQLLKYISDQAHLGFERSRAFEDAVIVGIGWLEDCLNDDPAEELVTSRYENWRNMLWDSASTRYDLEDARYLFRSKWVDVDVAAAYFPERRAQIVNAAGDASQQVSGLYATGDDPMDSAEQELFLSGVSGADTKRLRVRMIESWFKRPEMVPFMRGGPLHGEMFDKDEPIHQELLAQGVEIVVRRAMRVYCAIMTTQGLLWISPSPYRHNRYPFTPVWGYRRGRDNLPYGVIRGLRGLQEDINKRFSKALYILSTNKVIAEVGAIPDIKEFQKELNRPDGILQVNAGKMAGVVLSVDRELAPAHLDLMSRSIGMIQQVGGVTDELLGRTTNATSGVAVQARQQQGMMSTSKLFENLRFAASLQGEKQLSLVEQFFPDFKQFRITNMRGTPEYITINDGLPENDIARTKADFIISETDWRASVRQAQAEQLLEVVGRMPPDIALALMDLLVECMDLPNSEEVVRRIRAITGQRDPDQEELTPEDIQQMQAQQMQMQAQQAAFQAQLREAAARASRLEADAQKLLAQAQSYQADVTKKDAETVKTTIDAAQAALAPGVAPVADTMLGEVGFIPAPVKAQQAQIQALQQAEDERVAADLAQRQQQEQQQQPIPQQPGPTGTTPGA